MILVIACNAYFTSLWFGPENPSSGALTLSFSVVFTVLTRFLVRGIF